MNNTQSPVKGKRAANSTSPSGPSARRAEGSLPAQPHGALTKDRALEILAEIAESGEKAVDRLAALKVAGQWCGWERDGSSADDADGESPGEKRLLEGLRRLTYGVARDED
ncbi:MAG TPA: hypothetical protein VG796_21190 [Verrucomicrobiales bacterium]|jgi:hypothetical protein|nr:hypothetical protein [Verrucomicrobiales bacterium]